MIFFFVIFSKRRLARCSVVEAVAVVDGSTAVVGVSGADDDDLANKMMNSDVQMVSAVDPEIGNSCPRVIVQADAEEDRNIAADGSGDGRPVLSTCKFFVGFDMNGAHPDGVEDATDNGHQEIEVDRDTTNCACLGNVDDEDYRQVPEPTDSCNEVENLDRVECPDVDRSSPQVVAADESMLRAGELYSDDDDDNAVDVSELFRDAESADRDCERALSPCGDSVSDSVSFDANNDDVDGVDEELPESRSDSMLCRLPVSLDVVQELSDSGNEDVVAEKLAGIEPLALSPAPLSPTSPSSVFDHLLPGMCQLQYYCNCNSVIINYILVL